MWISLLFCLPFLFLDSKTSHISLNNQFILSVLETVIYDTDGLYFSFLKQLKNNKECIMGGSCSSSSPMTSTDYSYAVANALDQLLHLKMSIELSQASVITFPLATFKDYSRNDYPAF